LPSTPLRGGCKTGYCVKKKKFPNIAATVKSTLIKALTRLRSASKWSGMTGCSCRISITAKAPRIATASAIAHQVNAHLVLGRELLATRSPAEALPLWLHSLLTYNLTMRGLKEALMAGEVSPQTSECKAQMHAVGGELLARAQKAGAVRLDIEITDLLRLVHSIALMVEPGVEGAARAEHVFEVMIAGLKG
jgi:Transcriptional regulator SbtR-like, C-terminal domain